MNNKLKNIILDEAKKIGEQLISSSLHDKNGTYWSNMISKGRKSQYRYVSIEDLFNGISGIAFFFLELFKKTGEERFLKTARESFNWLIKYCENHPIHYSAFYTGRLGVCWTLLKIYELTGDAKYKNYALNFAKDSSKVRLSKQNELQSGLAGTLLGYLHLHAATKEDWILEVINKYISALLKNARLGSKGLYWDRYPDSIKSLCGFANGSAGIGFVFLELAHYFENPSFYWIAEQAFNYESSYFDKRINNWPDLRKSKNAPEVLEKLKNAYFTGDHNPFKLTADKNSWCIGAAGIGLSRLRAFELLNKVKYRNETIRSINKTLDTTFGKNKVNDDLFVLYYGLFGNAELFIESYKTFKQTKYLSFAEKVVKSALNNIKSCGKYKSGYNAISKPGEEDWSLLMGNAGIGYFYLRLLDPLNTPSVLYPKLDSVVDKRIKLSCYKYIKIKLDETRKKIIQNHFERTLFVLDKFIPRKADEYYKQKKPISSNEISSFKKLIKNSLGPLLHSKRSLLQDIYKLELTKFNLDQSIFSYAYLDMKSYLNREDNEELFKLHINDFKDAVLIFDPEIKLLTTNWDWEITDEEKWKINTDKENINSEGSDNLVILKQDIFSTKEINVSKFAAAIIQEFSQKASVQEVIKIILSQFKYDSNKQKRDIFKEIINQIKQLLSAQVIKKA